MSTLRFASLLAALLFAALLLPGKASAGDGFPGAPVSENAPGPFGGYGCLYTCGYDGRGSGCPDGCYRPGRCRCDADRRHPWPPFAPYAPTPYNAALRDYWDNAEAFRAAHRQFKEDNDTYRAQAAWYQDCMEHRGHCNRPPH